MVKKKIRQLDVCQYPVTLIFSSEVRRQNEQLLTDLVLADFLQELIHKWSRLRSLRTNCGKIISFLSPG
jgi:hypothetical protein